MGNNKEKAITKMSTKLREENAPAIVEIKVVDDEFSSYMERKIQDDTYRFSVLADLLKRKKQGEVFSIEDEACQYFKSSGRYIHMYLNILEKGIPQLRVMVEKGKVSVAFASRITGLSAKKQKSVVAQIKKCNKTVDANRYIATYMKTERVKKMTGRGDELLLESNRVRCSTFCDIAEDVLENDILNTSDKEKIIGICEKIIKKYQN